MRRLPIRYRPITRGQAIPARSRRTSRPAAEGLEQRLCPSGYLLVSSFDNNSVLRYDESTGAFVDAFVPRNRDGLREPMGVIYGPDQNVYVASGLEPNQGTGHKDVLRYDGATGAFLGDFADQNQVASLRAILFGPDGNLYVADGFSTSVARYNGTTGAFMDEFVAPDPVRLVNPVGMVFGPDGDLYVGAVFDNTILRYEGPYGPNPGAFLGTFVTAGSGGLSNPQGMVFGPDGDLYVASGNLFGNQGAFPPGSVLRYEGPGGPNPGAFLGTFVAGGSGGLNTPVGVLFGPDGRNDGKLDLYVTSCVGSSPNTGKLKLIADPGTSEVLRYDGTTGAFLDTFVAPDSGGLSFPAFMTFTETNPATLNYDGGAAGAAMATARPQPTTATRKTSTPGSLPGGGRFGLAAVPGSPGNTPATADAARPAPPPDPTPPPVTSLIGDLPNEGQPADPPIASRKSRSAADRLLVGLDIGRLLDPSAASPADGSRS